MPSLSSLLILVVLPWTKCAIEDGEKASSDLFTSTDELEKLFRKEREMHHRLKEYLHETDRQIKALDKLLDGHYADYHFEGGDEEAAKEYVSNPINTYVLLKRTGVHWPKAKKVVFNESAEDSFREIKDIIGTLPTQDDLEGAVNGIFLLQETYNLNITKFSEGELEVPGSSDVIRGRGKLDVFDLDILAKLSFNRGFYDRATEWIEAAIWKAKNKNQTKEQIKELERTAKVMRAKHDKVLVQKGPKGDNWRTFRVPFDEELAKKKKYKKIKDRRYKVPPVANSTESRAAGFVGDGRLWELFNAACRFEPGLRPPELDAGLGCQLIHNGDPFARLGPFKMETKNRAPFIAVFHDFMSDAETTAFRESTASLLHRSMHYGKDGTSDHATVKRTSSQAWLSEEENQAEAYTPYAKKVTKRILYATRLNGDSMVGGETYQVANYGIGGVYNHHTDSMGELGTPWPPTDEGLALMGDRVATAMAYLTDVDAGGATAFPNLGLAVKAKRGNLAFWFNNDRNGALDSYTFHGGCPVLAGSKWITNKWIRSLAQWHTIKCVTGRVTIYDLHRIPPINNERCKFTQEC